MFKLSIGLDLDLLGLVVSRHPGKDLNSPELAGDSDLDASIACQKGSEKSCLRNMRREDTEFGWKPDPAAAEKQTSTKMNLPNLWTAFSWKHPKDPCNHLSLLSAGGRRPFALRSASGFAAASQSNSFHL
jgi:hypothetical protein